MGVTHQEGSDLATLSKTDRLKNMQGNKTQENMMRCEGKDGEGITVGGTGKKNI